MALTHGITSLLAALKDASITARAAAQQAIDAIGESEHNAFLNVDPATVLADADRIDARRAAGESLGALAGVPIAVKDNICVRGGNTTAGSRILKDFVAPYDATVVEKLKAADAVLVGKTNLDEFAMGSSNENSYFGSVTNPRDTTRVPGGSSGGSAAAVAADLCAAALGSDTGGSIRQPAAHCGLVGLKPTYGRVSRFGLIAFASSLDQIGPLTKTVADSALLLQTIAGHDRHDMTSAPIDVPDFSAELDRGVHGLTLGVPREYLSAADGLDPGVKSAVEATLADLEAAGANLVEIDMPHTRYAVGTYYLIATAEASSNLARFDGVRYGHRAADARELIDLYEQSRSEGFGAEVKRRIMLGTYVLSSGFYDAYYKKAQRVRTLIRRDFDEAFLTVDAIVGPTTPTPAFKLGEKTANPLQMYLEDIFTISCNLAGVPGVSVPCGTSNGLPVGFQIMTPAWQEARALRVAQSVERRTS